MNPNKGAQPGSKFSNPDRMTVKVIKWDNLAESVRDTMVSMAAKPGHKNASQFARMTFGNQLIVSVRQENSAVPRLSITVEDPDHGICLSYINYERLMRMVRNLEPATELSSAAEA